MQRRALVVMAVVVGFAAPAAAEVPVERWPWPQLSYTVALGKSDTGLLMHMWIGAGVRDSSRKGVHAFALGGVEIDFRDRARYHDDATVAREVSTAGGTEAWLTARVGLGAFKERGLAPLAAMYMIAGQRVGGPDRAPLHRIGLGVSAPGVADPLWRIGIPTMLEAGIDAGGEASGVRGFVRIGFNF